MGESTKAVCSLFIIVGVIATALAWTIVDSPDATAWAFRLGGPVVAVLALILLLKLQFRVDLEHDYLQQLTGSYFNRDGFCFTFVVTARDGVAYMNAYFQSQYDKPLHGQIALRPARGFFLSRANLDTITFDINCPPAGFGYVSIPIPIPRKLEGARQSFEVGASVEYPEGKGTRLRFRDGLFLRANSNFQNSFATTLTVAGAATGSLILTSPATVTVLLPRDVTEDVPLYLKPEEKPLWKLGDPQLEHIV